MLDCPVCLYSSSGESIGIGIGIGTTLEPCSFLLSLRSLSSSNVQDTWFWCILFRRKFFPLSQVTGYPSKLQRRLLGYAHTTYKLSCALCSSITCCSYYGCRCCCLVDQDSPCSTGQTHPQQPHHARRVAVCGVNRLLLHICLLKLEASPRLDGFRYAVTKRD